MEARTHFTPPPSCRPLSRLLNTKAASASHRRAAEPFPARWDDHVLLAPAFLDKKPRPRLNVIVQLDLVDTAIDNFADGVLKGYQKSHRYTGGMMKFMDAYNELLRLFSGFRLCWRGESEEDSAERPDPLAGDG
jgi:hypothetical protein